MNSSDTSKSHIWPNAVIYEHYPYLTYFIKFFFGFISFIFVMSIYLFYWCCFHLGFIYSLFTVCDVNVNLPSASLPKLFITFLTLILHYTMSLFYTIRYNTKCHAMRYDIMLYLTALYFYHQIDKWLHN